MKRKFDRGMIQDVLENGYAKVPADFNGEDPVPYTDESLFVDKGPANPLMRGVHVEKFRVRESAVSSAELQWEKERDHISMRRSATRNSPEWRSRFRG